MMRMPSRAALTAGVSRRPQAVRKPAPKRMAEIKAREDEKNFVMSWRQAAAGQAILPLHASFLHPAASTPPTCLQGMVRCHEAAKNKSLMGVRKGKRSQECSIPGASFDTSSVHTFKVVFIKVVKNKFSSLQDMSVMFYLFHK